MSSINNNPFHRLYQGFVNSPMIETLSSSSLYQTVKERFADFSIHIPVDQILTKLGLDNYKVDPKWAQENVCSFQEKVQNAHIEVPKLFRENAFRCLSDEKQLEFFQNVAITPLTEQAIFQGFIQDFLFTRLPRSTQPLFMQNQPDSTLTRLARAVVTAGAYTGYKFFGASCQGEIYDTEKLIVTFAEGLFYSAIKETNLGIVGSTVAQIGLQALTHYPSMDVCAAPSWSPPGGYPRIQ